jgi:orotidine-5'-phosphate decarboxylase
VPEALPRGFGADAAGVERFARLLLEAAGPLAAAVKVNLAFFEALGSAGFAALERIREHVPADLPFIADAKRGDIGSTAERHARALFDALRADAVTVSPYLGRDSLDPLLERADRLVYVLCRTSNPGAGELQELMLESDPVHGYRAEPVALRVARLVAGWERHPGTVGLVVGATTPSALASLRDTVPDLPFLVPGVGSQGGDVGSAMSAGPARGGIAGGLRGGGLLVNVSRGIASAALDPGDPDAAVAAAAGTWARTLQVLG